MAKTKSTVLLDDRKWRTYLKRIKTRSKEGIAKLKILSQTFAYKDIVDHFRKEQGSNGAWKAWSESYARIARAKGQKKILQDTGHLRKSINLIGTGQNILQKSRYSLLLFTNVPYAAKHNYGEGKFPKRDFMYLSESILQKLADSLIKWIGE